MLTASPQPNNQLGLWGDLMSHLNQKHPLYILANKIDWSVFESAFKKHYSEKMGKPSKPIRLMVSLLILKQVRNLSDESIVEQWSENIYYQYFSGEQSFQPGIPCVPTELVAFRKRIGEEGVELILKESIRVNEPPDDAGNAVVSIDTTVQEKNITYPTDDKLYKKIIRKCWRIADESGVSLRQSYVRTVKKLSTLQRFKNSKHGAKQARKASRRIKTIAATLVRELGRKLSLEHLGKHLPKLKLYWKVLLQQRSDSNKIYSLHEPDVKCYTKGKEHKKFEFGSKVSILACQKTGILMGALSFAENVHDSKTLPEVLEQFERLRGKEVKEAFVDRGYRGMKYYKNTIIQVPKPDNHISRTKRKRHSKRAGIEPVISHLKSGYRMGRNYLKGIIGDKLNAMLAAAAMNFQRAMNLWRTEANLRWKLLLLYSYKVKSNILSLFFLKPTF
jgi:IS5 family transposase